MSHHRDVFLRYDLPYAFVYYAYKSNHYFLRTAMKIIICSLVNPQHAHPGIKNIINE